MSSNDTFFEQLSANHLGSIDTRLKHIDARLAHIGTQSTVANAIAYLNSGQATEEEADRLRAFVRRGLNLSKS